jgi:hypothetical protein
MDGAIIDRDGKFSQPNFDPEGFIRTAFRLLDIRGNLVHVWYRPLRNEAFDHGLFFPPYKFFHDKTPSNCVTFGNHEDDLLPSHCSGLLSCWGTCLATVLRKPNTLADVHPAKKTVLAMDNGFDMIIPIIRHTHPMYATSCALGMNAPTQEVGMTISDAWDAFKDHKQIQTVYEGSAYNLKGETVVYNFSHNCRDSTYILCHFDNEKNNPSNDYKWKPDQFANTIQGFFLDGSYEVYCKQNGGTKHQPMLKGAVSSCHSIEVLTNPETSGTGSPLHLSELQKGKQILLLSSMKVCRFGTSI